MNAQPPCAPPPPASLPPSRPTVPASPGTGVAGLVWACPCCRAALRTTSGPQGQRGACPACGALIEAPDLPATNQPSLDQPPSAAIASPSHAAPEAPPAHGSRSRRRVRLLVMLAALAALVGAAIGLHRARPWSGLLQPSFDSLTPPPATTEELQATLHRFLKAKDWKAKRAFILDAARLDEAGAAYYAGRDPDRIDAGAFSRWSIPPLDRHDGVIVLGAERPHRRPVLAIFREIEGRWYLDWELFCQTYDESLPAFLAQPSFPIRTFRARLARVFATAENEASAYTVELIDPIDAGQRLTLALPPGTPIMRSVAGGLDGTRPREATVQVCWARPDPEGEWIPMLQRLVCWGWDGLNGLPETITPALPTHERFLLPSSAPRSSPAPAAELSLASSVVP